MTPLTEKSIIEDNKSIKQVTMPEKIEDESDLLVLSSNNDKDPSLPTLIAEEVDKRALLFTDGKETAYAKYNASIGYEHDEVRPIASKRFSRWLFKIGRILNKDQDIPGAEAVTVAQKYLEALAFDGPEIELGNRVMKLKNDFWYDLSNEKWQAIRINENGWKVINNPPALFKRQSHQNAQVKPSNEGNIWKFFDFVKVPEERKLLILVYIVSCFIPDIPHPVLIIYGPQGSGKSMSMEFMRNIIDPSQTPRLKIPKGDKEIVQTFDHHYASFFDNLDIIPTWLSDVICRAVTGEGSEFRALYTDDGSVIRSYRRCVILNGINIAATKGDLLDRAILMKLEPFERGERIEEKILKEKFNNTLPEILGGIFNVLVDAIRIYPMVNLNNLPRMADFAKWGYAIAEAIGGYGEEFIKSYSEDEEERVHETAEANPFATALIALMEDYKDKWEGKPTELLGKLEIVAEDNGIPTTTKLWPKGPVWVTRRLNEIEPTLKELGILFHTSRDGGERYITLKHRKNTVNTVIPSQNVEYMLENDAKSLKSSNEMTVNMTVNEKRSDSKNSCNSFDDQMDSNDSNDSKISLSNSLRDKSCEKSYELENSDNESYQINFNDLDLLDKIICLSIECEDEIKSPDEIINYVKNRNQDLQEDEIKNHLQCLIKDKIILNNIEQGQTFITINNEILRNNYEL